MNADTFNQLLERKLADSRAVLASKATEYSHGGDRLSNFKRAAGMLDCEPEAALLGFVTKHITALYDFVAGLPGGDITLEQWAEKTGDIRNYMILLDGLIEERLDYVKPAAPSPMIPANNYYYLKNGDMIQAGDQIFDKPTGCWTPNDLFACGSYYQVIEGPSEVNLMRRPL